MVLLIACSFFIACIPTADADIIPPNSEITLLDQNFSLQPVIPSNVVVGNNQFSYTSATLSYNSAAKAIEYRSTEDEAGSAFVGIEPFINGNLTISLKVNSNSEYSSVNIQGSTFWIETRSLSGGGARVISYYMPTATSYSYQYYDVPASSLPNGVNDIHIMVSGTTKTLTVYHDSTRKVTTPLYHWSVQALPYAPITSPVIAFDHYKSSGSTYVSTLLYGIKETVSGGLVSAVPGNGFVPFGIDYPRTDSNSLGTSYMNNRGQKGVVWADLQWLAYQPQDKPYIDSLLAAGWELGIHYNTALNSHSLSEAQTIMRQQYDQLTQMFGRAPTSWCSYQNSDSVTHATYAYQQMGMLWRNGYSGITYIANVGNLQETRWTEFWSKVSNAQMVYPSFTHKTDQSSAEAYSISYSSFTKWIDNYQGKKIIGFNEYYHRVSNQVDTKVHYLEYTQGAKLKFSVQCNEFQSRLMVDFPNAATAVVTKNGSPLVLNTDYTVVSGHYIVLFARSNDVIEVSSYGAPGAPRGVVASAGNAQVVLNWTAPSSNGGSAITNYKIYRGTTAGGETLLTTLGNVLIYTDSAVTNGLTYYYKVSAVTSIGEGPRSSEVSATPAAPLTVPSAPSITSAARGDAQVTLTWTAPSNSGGTAITGYKIYRGTTAGGEVLFTTVGNVLTYTDTGLTNGQTYYYKVSAVNSVGEGPQSNEMSATPATVPSAPQNLAATAGNGQVVLTWSAPSNNGGSAITGYKIYRGTTSGGETLLTTLGNVLTYTNTGLTNGQTYYYKVSAVNAVNEGQQSSEASATPVSVPSAPQNLAVNAGNAQVTLTWNAPANIGGSSITGYKVYRGTTSGGETLLTTVGNVLTYVDNTAVNGQTYYYKVSAVNSIGEGPQSSEASATPSTVPSAPQNLIATGGDAQVTLTWSAPSTNGGSAVTGYKVYRGTTSGSEVLLTTVGNLLTYTDMGLTNGQAYFYKVAAVNAVGEGGQSNEASATPEVVLTAPSAPRNLVAGAGNTAIVLTWSAPLSDGGSAVTAYNIYRGGVLLTTVGNVLTYTDTGLTNGQSYSYTVSAVNSISEGAQSNQASATPATVPSAPQGLVAAPGNAKVTLTWTAPSSNGGSPITNYKVYRGTTSGGETLLTTVGNVLTYVDNTAVNGQTYYYKVSAVSSAGEGVQSNEASATPATVPSAPQNLVATPGNAQVTLTWSAPSNNGGASITGYKIYRGTTSGGETLLTTLGNVLTYTDTGLTNGQRYYYKVSAINSVGDGAMSSEASATPAPPATVPSAPQSLVATAGDAQVTLTWSAPSSNGGSAITNYKVYRGTTSGSEVLLTTVGNVLTFVDTGLTNDQAYFYKVSAVNSVGEGAQSGEAQATPFSVRSDDFEYVLTNGNTEVQITGYNGNGGAVVIPSSIVGKPVTSIANWVFYANTAITSVTMPGSMRTIGSGVFYECTALATVTLNSGLVTIGDHSFYGTTALTSITIPVTVTTLGPNAFTYSGLKSATIPGSITSIGEYTFYGCSAMTSLTLNSGLQSIGTGAFRGCVALASVNIPGTVTSIGGYAFFGCTAMTSLTISSGVQSIGTYAFYGCSSITSLTIPGTVTSIGAYAFYKCSALASLTLNSGLVTIGDHVFYYCAALTSVTIPGTVTAINAYAFYGCTGMTSMYFAGNAPTVGTGWISYRNASLVIYYHSGATGFTSPTWQGVPTATY